MRRWTPFSCWIMFLLTSPGAADDPAAFSPEQLEFFEKRIRPVLVQHCYECHSVDSKILRGGLMVDSRGGLLQGGDTGPAVVPGAPGESLLLAALRHESYEMPPQGKLPAAVIQDFETWIANGAADPRTEVKSAAKSTGMSIEEGRRFWAFQPLGNAAVPQPRHADWSRSEIDAFILARLESDNRQPGSDADRLTLLRRLYFDLVGLPPTPEQIRTFLQDDSPNAVDGVVDSLLESPHFGERWGRHWLDVARYSDSTGGGRSLLYEQSWKYRDYVIDAFNRDLPFDRLILEQIAGDLLPYEDDQQRRRQLSAIAFLALGPHNYEAQDKELLRMDVIDEQLDTIGKAFLAMTIGCARCHDHKFDPIPQKDYYALAGIFRSTNSLVDGNVSGWVKVSLPETPELQGLRREHAGRTERLNREIAAATEELRSLEMRLPQVVLDDDQATYMGEWTASTSVKGFFGEGYRHAKNPGATARFTIPLTPGSYVVQLAYTPGANRPTKAEIAVVAKGEERTVAVDQTLPPPIENQYFELGRFEFDQVAIVEVRATDNRPTVVDAVRLLSLAASPETDAKLLQEIAEKQKALQKLRSDLEQLKKQTPQAETVVGVEEQKTPGDYHICIRGNHNQLGEVVPRGFLSVIPTGVDLKIPSSQSGRLELARWIADPANPLTARVIVNRVWSKLFGFGLVRSVDNFGTPGEMPTHPELLDHLARQFVNDGWSIKRLIRRVVLSRTYRLAVPVGPLPETDPENRLLAFQNRRRLDAESFHDAMLLISGELDCESGGNSLRPDVKSEYDFQFTYGRRAVYLPVFRNNLPEIFVAFDFADPNLPIGSRPSTTLSTQALLMLNGPFTLDRVQRAAVRVVQEHRGVDSRLDWLAWSCFGRPLTSDERQVIDRYLAVHPEHDDPATWEAIVQAMFAGLAFRTLN